MTTRPVTHTAVAGMTMVTAGAMTANIAGYLLHVPASRWLGLDGYSEFAALLTAQLILAVPALALQTVVAREVVHGASDEAMRRLTHRCAAIVGVVALVLVPLISQILHVSVLATAAALLATPALVVLCGEQGLLQGRGQFRELAYVLGMAGIARVAPAVVVLGLGAWPAPALVASAAGSALMAAAARIVVGKPVDRDHDATRVSVAAVLRASQVQLALVVLSSIDLVIARIVLNGDDASLYALGAVATKAAFWLPQAVGVVLYPRMAHPEHSASAVRSALAVLLGLGAVTVVGAAVASPLLPLVVGDAYAPIKGMLWAFALDGALLAVLQGALLSVIAGGRTRLALIAWVGLAVEVTAMLTLANSVGQLIAIAVAGAALTAGVASITVLRTTPKRA